MGDYYDKLGYSESLPSTDLRYIGKQTQEEKYGDYLGAAFSEAMTPAAIGRLWNRRSSRFEQDPEWSIDEAILPDLQRDYNQKEEDYLTESKSEEEFIAKKKYIQEDKDRLEAIGRSGMKGIGATIGFSLIDPVGIALGAATGGWGWGAKATGVAKAGRVALLTGIENAAIETVIASGNTQSKATDVMIAFGTGGLIGAAMSPLVRARNPKAGRLADEADAAAHLDADAHVADEILQEARVTQPVTDIDNRTIDARLSEYRARLTRETTSPLTKGQIKQVRKKMAKLEVEARTENENIRKAQGEVTEARERISTKQKEFVEEVSVKRTKIDASYTERIKAQKARIAVVEKNLAKAKDKNKQAAKLWKEEAKLEEIRDSRKAEIQKVEKKFKRRIANAEHNFKKQLAAKADVAKANRNVLGGQMREHVVKLEESARAKQSMNDIRKFEGMSRGERVSHVYGEEPLPLKAAELKRQLEGYAPIREGVPEASTVEPVAPVEPGTGGAMMTGQRMVHRVHDIPFEKQKDLARFAYDGSNMPDDLRGREFLGQNNIFQRFLYSAQTVVSNSRDLAIKGFGYHLFEAPQGGTAAKVTVAARVRNYQNQIRSAMRNKLNEGVEEWGVEQGIGRVALLMKKKNFGAFNKMVMQEVKRPGSFDSPAIQKAAEGVRDQLKKAGEIRKNAGEGGFENLDLDKNYVPTILDETMIKNATTQHGKGKVKDLLSLSYQEGHFKLDKNLADRVAEGYMARAMDHSLTMQDFMRTTTLKDMDKLADDLKLAGIDKDTIEDFMDSSMSAEVRQHMSNRAKKSLYPSLESELNGLKMIDLVDSDLPKLLESYTRDAAGGASFAKLGFKTRASVIDFLNDMEKAAQNNGFSPGKTGQEIQILRDGVDLAYGRSLNKDAHSPWVRNLGRLRDMTSLIRLQFVGAASIPELARVTAQRGLGTVLKNVPDLGAIMGTKNLRKGGKYSGQFKRADLKELEEVMGYIGEDFVLYPNGLRVDNLEESGFGNRFGELMDNALAQGQRIQEITSGFRAVQGTGEKLAVRSLGQQIKKWVDGTGGALSESNINRAGWSDGFLDDLKDWMKGNPATDDFQGSPVRLFNFGKMPADMQERLQIGMHRLIAADMQRPMIGESSTFMNRWLGQTLTQFRSFSLLSLEKQLVADIRHDKIAGATIAMHSLVMAYAALSLQTMHNAIGRDDAEEYIKDRLASNRTIIDVISRMGQTASLQTGLDMFATLGLLPEELTASPRNSGGRVLGVNSIPAVGLMTDVGGALRSIGETIVGAGEDADVLKEVRKITPFAKTIGINQALNVIQ